MEFGNEFAWNFVIFGVHNSLLSYGNNCKNSILVLGEAPIDDIKVALVQQKNILVLI